MLIDFFFDFETRSKLDLKKVGTIVYATEESTEVTLLTWAFGSDGDVKYWKKGDPLHTDIIHVAMNPDKFHFIAHNILFDYTIWTVVLKRLIPGLIRPGIKNITDNMALTHYNRLGSSLDGSAAMLRIPYSKDKEGRRLMLKQCKPSKAGKFYTLTPSEEVSFIKYGVIDTKLLRDVYYKCVPLTPSERWGFEWTFIRNLRGVRIDMDLIDELESILSVEIPRLKKEFFDICGFHVSQRVKCQELFGKFYGMENMQAATVKEVLSRTFHPHPQVHRALQIKQEVGSTSLAKVDVARRMNYNGRLYDIWNFLKAGTRRWAGKGIQPQNFPRTDKIPLLEDLNVRDLADKVNRIKHLSTDQCKLVKDLLRRMWIADDDDKVFYCGDFSKIEPTVLFWMLGMGKLSPTWYEEMASEIYGIPKSKIKKDSVERQIGKNSALGCGYGLGALGFTTQVKAQAGIDLTPELAQRAVSAYRRVHWQVVDFWKLLEVGFRTALQGRTASLCQGKLTFMPMVKPLGGVKVRLPSGSFLFYPGAKQKDGKLYYEVFEKGAVRDEGTYGGKLCENVISGTARDIMLSSMFKLEEKGFENLGTVHDEVWSQAPSGLEDLFEKTMASNPAWCRDMHISVDAGSGVRYLK